MPETNAESRAGGSANTEKDEHESDSEPGGFALSVDLSAYMGSQARCRVWVRRRARKVRWLASRVRKVAKLRGPLLLLAGDHLLPPSEPIKVLRPDDTVRVTQVEHEWQHAFSIEDSDDDALMPMQPVTIIQNRITQTHTKHNGYNETKQIKEATNIYEEAAVVPDPSPVQQLLVQKKPTTQPFNKQDSLKKTTNLRETTTTIEQSLAVSRKRKFTVGDTLFLLKRAEESKTQALPEIEPKQTTPSPKPIENNLEFGQMSQPNFNSDALDQVKRRALALLEQVTDDKDTDVTDAPKKKRRRVRRRRPKPSREEFIQELDESGAQKASQLNAKHANLTKEQDIQNGLKPSLNNHVDLTKEQDDYEAKVKMIKTISISPEKSQDLSKDNDSESDDSDLNEPEKQTDLTAQPLHSVQAVATPTMLVTQSSPAWVVDYVDMPPESQIPVLVRDAMPRPPRVVRALGNTL
ncbi:uncharacterized protein LOC125227735 [Leguminivora glycinivorella]|uniref:uncharacterized protein LOC125227735 n=1 Tax=Leguminivora glycinivorella TaxID=1035111 RepID=UPI00200FA81F|nr:uncharacterized protein LOC125227735 [Leguminivora glycinivorella]